ncbi:hypothetical protein [Botrimarina sp.]|uniref:hypothetical protein n=1 Tax=Botrimarina sp. TaxID=2795802 RepID=UPI0032EFA3C6
MHNIYWLEKRVIDLEQTIDKLAFRLAAVEGTRAAQPEGEQHRRLTGAEAAQAFDELVCDAAKVEFACEAPAATEQRVRKKHPELARAADDYWNHRRLLQHARGSGNY